MRTFSIPAARPGALRPPEAVQIQAARCWVDEQYHGLASGNGKAAVVQRLRESTSAGYPLDADAWLRKYSAAGAEFRHATTVDKIVMGIETGIPHRIAPSYGPKSSASHASPPPKPYDLGQAQMTIPTEVT